MISMWQRWEIACTRVMTMQACWSEKNVILLFESGGSQITSKTRKVWEFQASVRILGYTRRNVGIWKKCSLFFGVEIPTSRASMVYMYIIIYLYLAGYIPTYSHSDFPFYPLYPHLSISIPYPGFFFRGTGHAGNHQGIGGGTTSWSEPGQHGGMKY